MKILLVCTANRCRSPMAAVLLEEALRAQGVEDVHVASAGRLHAGEPVSSGAARAMARRGLDVGAHRSATLSGELITDADLVVAMAREHVRDVVVLDRSAFSKTFTLKELVRRGEAVHGRRPGEPVVEWLASVSAGRDVQGLLGADPCDDIADPIGRPDQDYEHTVVELVDLLQRLLRLIRPASD